MICCYFEWIPYSGLSIMLGVFSTCWFTVVDGDLSVDWFMGWNRLKILCCSAVMSLIVPRLVLSSFKLNDCLSIIELSAIFGVSAPDITLWLVPTTKAMFGCWIWSFPFGDGGFLTVCYFENWPAFFLMPTLLIPTSIISLEWFDLLLLWLNLALINIELPVIYGESASPPLLKSTEI